MAIPLKRHVKRQGHREEDIIPQSKLVLLYSSICSRWQAGKVEDRYAGAHVILQHSSALVSLPYSAYM
jgi:hypothetical protein